MHYSLGCLAAIGSHWLKGYNPLINSSSLDNFNVDWSCENGQKSIIFSDTLWE